MNKILIGVVGIVLIVVGIVIFSGNADEQTRITPSEEPSEAVSDKDEKPTLSVPAPALEQKVIITGHKIANLELTVPVGGTVVFENRDDLTGFPYSAHTITSGVIDPVGIPGVVPNSGAGTPDGVFSSPLAEDETFSYRFSEPGEFTFYVAEHPLVSGDGTITVTVVEEMIAEGGSDELSEETTGVSTAEVIEMDSGGFYFTPSTLTASVGEQIDIDVTSAGLHTFTIDELGVDVETPHGETTRVSFTPDRAGTFTYYCAIPGHTEAGQIGTITVTDTAE